MTSIVCVSDLHLDHSTHGVSRFDEVVRVVFASTSRAVEERAAAWMFLGDACDPDSGPIVFKCVEVLVEAARRLCHAGIPSVFLAGNHDVVAVSDLRTTLTPLRALWGPFGGDLVHVFEEPGCAKIPGLPKIVAFPFVAPSHAYDPEEWARAQVQVSRESTMTIEHLHVPGVQPGEETKEIPRGREVVFPGAATAKAVMRLGGHYHRGQTVDLGDGGPPLVICGSPIRFTFGEEHNEENGFMIVRVP